MKKQFVTLFALLLVVSSLAVANALLATFSWSETTHDFGRIPQNKPVTATFTFTNKGTAPLIVSNARGSCGCTGVTYTKEPIMPGASGTVQATYNAAAPGAFNKSVTVESNAEGGLVTLYFNGEVVVSGAVGQ